MTIYAELFTHRGCWRSDIAYHLADNDPLFVSFGEKYAGDTLSVRGVANVRTLRLDESGTVEIPVEMIKTGSLVMHVERYDSGKLMRTWKVDPLTVTVTDADGVTATPWTVSIEERIGDLENAIFGQSSPIFE